MHAFTHAFVSRYSGRVAPCTGHRRALKAWALNGSCVLQVVAVPDDMEYHGRGPMLSARRIDLNLLWRRAEQIQQACAQVRCLLQAPKFYYQGITTNP